ncbi:glyoxalase [Amycolatopsis carbonis]|uniref:Glyoxalase n=1 Tax=Amycolatopsis carbonis TaxID=715471 RepID=A0A9Y2IPW9_9PSEU|nr:VOC family protein [Amycolatopsis sp. 2-15]WIX83344.1 glyoxalase [Amycolatopsis sp. 2-15]
MTTEDVRRVDMKVEVLVLPVADVERAKEFYGRLGWRLDVTPPAVVQFTPHGSDCSVQFGDGLTDAEPGSGKAYLVVADIVAARDALVAAGVEVGEIFHDGPDGRETGVDPDCGTYRSRATFADPDGNQWLLQEITSSLSRRVDPAEAAFSSAGDLAAALRRAEAAHGEHEKRTGERDVNWPDWYAEYMVAERTGTQLPT